MGQEAPEIRVTPETIALLRQSMDERRNRFRFVNWIMSFGCGATVISLCVGLFLAITTFMPELETVGGQLPGLIIQRLAPAAGVQIQMPDSSQPSVVVVTATPLPTSLPTPTSTSTPHAPRVRALMNANLRSAPDINSANVGLIGPQSIAGIVARTQNGAWYLIKQNNRLAWVSASVVQIEAPTGLASVPIWGETLTTVSAVGDLSFQNGADPSRNLGRPHPYPSPTPVPATPIPEWNSVTRIYVRQTTGYREALRQEAYLDERLRDVQIYPFDNGKFLIANTSQILEINMDGSGSRIILSDKDIVYKGKGHWSNPHDLIFSPSGRKLAFVGLSGDDKCLNTVNRSPCKTVFIWDFATKTLTGLTGPGGINARGLAAILDLEAPRWLQNGDIMVLAHPNEPADGVAYVYTTFDKGTKTVPGQIYDLAVSHDGQQYHPYLPDHRPWQAGSSTRQDTYYPSVVP